MEVQKVLYMNRGDGEASYAKNSSIQREVIEVSRSVMKEALLDLYHAVGFPGKLTVADLGCSSGPNTLTVVADVVDTVRESCRQLCRSTPEFQLFLNDLPGNDFNSVFRSLEGFYKERERGREIRRCFIAGVPGSFYGRLFPSRSIHFFHSSTSLHWLSQVLSIIDTICLVMLTVHPAELIVPLKLQQHEDPLNKGSIYISERSPSVVVHAYSTQFRKDFSDFLKCRSEEMVVGGRMVLTIVGRRALDPTRDESHFHWYIIGQLLMDMAEEGYIEEEKVDSFNLPYYAPSASELESEIQSDQGSFSLKRLEIFEVPWEACQSHGEDDHGEPQHGCSLVQKMTIGQSMSNCLRAVLESMLASHFGGDILQDLFSRYSKVLEDRLSREKLTVPNIVMSLVRKP
ncbi:hypothetical protein Taro_014875 [Colocasia esculenta]|uniref:Jasmonate O-methyltransferase n=1 Tax=Colocasia esculenta TaxID=4460 RepID=A0A843UG86_COLES|nr:hypothetical protein [Colocasia esculenta]